MIEILPANPFKPKTLWLKDEIIKETEAETIVLFSMEHLRIWILRSKICNGTYFGCGTSTWSSMRSSMVAQSEKTKKRLGSRSVGEEVALDCFCEGSSEMTSSPPVGTLVTLALLGVVWSEKREEFGWCLVRRRLDSEARDGDLGRADEDRWPLRAVRHCLRGWVVQQGSSFVMAVEDDECWCKGEGFRSLQACMTL